MCIGLLLISFARQYNSNPICPRNMSERNIFSLAISHLSQIGETPSHARPAILRLSDSRDNSNPISE